MSDEDNPFDGYEPMFSEDDIEELRAWVIRESEAKKIDVSEARLARILKPYTQIFVDENDDILFIDPEESLIFN